MSLRPRETLELKFCLVVLASESIEVRVWPNRELALSVVPICDGFAFELSQPPFISVWAICLYYVELSNIMIGPPGGFQFDFLFFG